MTNWLVLTTLTLYIYNCYKSIAHVLVIFQGKLSSRTISFAHDDLQQPSKRLETTKKLDCLDVLPTH